MLPKLSHKQIESLAQEFKADEIVKLVGMLNGRQNVSEFKIAEKLNVTVNRIRNMLYTLQDHNLVSSTRKKDRKKGWYIYYWTFNPIQANDLVKSLKVRRINDLKQRLEKAKQGAFFRCRKHTPRLNLQQAMEIDFKCPNCESVMVEDNGYVAELMEQIQMLEKGLE